MIHVSFLKAFVVHGSRGEVTQVVHFVKMGGNEGVSMHLKCLSDFLHVKRYFMVHHHVNQDDLEQSDFVSCFC